MEAEIGQAGGTIWRYLRQHGELSIAKLKQGTKLPERLHLMGCGWLAREGKPTLIKERRSVRAYGFTVPPPSSSGRPGDPVGWRSRTGEGSGAQVSARTLVEPWRCLRHGGAPPREVAAEVG